MMIVRRLGYAFIFLFGVQAPELLAGESQCFGTVSKGRLEAGVKLPASGPNFSPYSNLGVLAGRTWVHSRVADVFVASYRALAEASPSVTFVYGETGFESGGRFKPHRTHQNGLSIDFFVPVRDAAGKSVALPTGVTNRLGYDIEFDAGARHGEYSIDFDAMSEHLYQLHIAARKEGIDIALVIFDRSYLPKLFSTARGPYLRKNLPFMKGKPWVRHDDHYHVDFKVPCKPNKG